MSRHITFLSAFALSLLTLVVLLTYGNSVVFAKEPFEVRRQHDEKDDLARPAAAASSTTRNVLSLQTAQACFAAMNLADTNKNDELDRDEYVLFVNLQGGAAWAGFTYDQLPAVLRGNFVSLAGSAQDDTIDIFGSKQGQEPSEEQAAYLDSVCSQTNQAIEVALSGPVTTLAPSSATPEPSPSPETTTFPTLPSITTSVPTAAVPVEEPTGTPSTTAPSAAPTEEPEPTESPTFAPSESPTTGPTFAPSSESTLGPTEETESPSLTPAPTETPSPTQEPSSSFLPTATVSPTRTRFPTASPSSSPSLVEPPTAVPTTPAPSLGTTEPTRPPLLRVPAAFVISNTDGLTASDLERGQFRAPLDNAYRVTAQDVVETTPITPSRNRRLLWQGTHRRLQVTYFSSEIGPIRDQPCPSDAPEQGTLCQSLLMAFFRVDISEEQEASTQDIIEQLNAAMMTAINDGTLQDNLNAISPDSPIRVERGIPPGGPPTPTPPSGSDDDDGLSGGAIAGIVVGSVFGVALIVFLLTRYTKLLGTRWQHKPPGNNNNNHNNHDKPLSSEISEMPTCDTTTLSPSPRPAAAAAARSAAVTTAAPERVFPPDDDGLLPVTEMTPPVAHSAGFEPPQQRPKSMVDRTPPTAQLSSTKAQAAAAVAAATAGAATTTTALGLLALGGSSSSSGGGGVGQSKEDSDSSLVIHEDTDESSSHQHQHQHPVIAAVADGDVESGIHTFEDSNDQEDSSTTSSSDDDKNEPSVPKDVESGIHTHGSASKDDSSETESGDDDPRGHEKAPPDHDDDDDKAGFTGTFDDAPALLDRSGGDDDSSDYASSYGTSTQYESDESEISESSSEESSSEESDESSEKRKEKKTLEPAVTKPASPDGGIPMHPK